MDILNNYNLEEDAECGASYTLLDPRTGSELDITFEIRGTDSETHDKLLRIEQDSKLILGDKYNYDAGEIRMLSGLIIGWTNILDGDKEFSFSSENAIHLLTKKRWVFDQIKSFAETRTNFFLD